MVWLREGGKAKGMWYGYGKVVLTGEGLQQVTMQ